MVLPASAAKVGDGVIEAGENETDELARAVQNPIASLISLPFQNNTGFNFGPQDKTQNIMNIQPVWPFELNEDWNVITRTILPVVSQPAFTSRALKPHLTIRHGLLGTVRTDRFIGCASPKLGPPASLPVGGVLT